MDAFRNGGKEPQSEITLCFGEELNDGDNISDKHIIIKVKTLCEGIMDVYRSDATFVFGRCTAKKMNNNNNFTFPKESLFWVHFSFKIFSLQISVPWVELQIEEVKTLRDPIAILKCLASQSPTGEVTLNLC